MALPAGGPGAPATGTGNRRGAGSSRAPQPTKIGSARDRLNLLPFQELTEQRLAILGPARREAARLVFAQELIEPAARVGRGHGAAVAIEPLLRRLEPRPAGQRCVERDLLPLRVERRVLRD